MLSSHSSCLSVGVCVRFCLVVCCCMHIPSRQIPIFLCTLLFIIVFGIIVAWCYRHCSFVVVNIFPGYWQCQIAKSSGYLFSFHFARFYQFGAINLRMSIPIHSKLEKLNDESNNAKWKQFAIGIAQGNNDEKLLHNNILYIFDVIDWRTVYSMVGKQPIYNEYSNWHIRWNIKENEYKRVVWYLLTAPLDIFRVFLCGYANVCVCVDVWKPRVFQSTRFLPPPPGWFHSFGSCI